MHGIYFKSENELNHFCFSGVTSPFEFIFFEMIEKKTERLVEWCPSWNKTIMEKNGPFLISAGSFKVVINQVIVQWMLQYSLA